MWFFCLLQGVLPFTNLKQFAFCMCMACVLLFNLEKERKFSNIVCDVAAEFPVGWGFQKAVCPAYNILCFYASASVRPSSRLSARQSCPSLSCSLGIEGLFGLFVIFKNQICPGTNFQQQLILLYVLFKTLNFESLMFPMTLFLGRESCEHI